MNPIDISIQNYFSLIRTPKLTEFLYLISRLFDFSWQFVLVMVLFCILIYVVRNLDYVFLFVSSLVFGGIIIYGMKTFFNVARPLGGVTEVFGQSFPSYHATIATIFFTMLIYIFDDYLESFGRVIFNTFCVTFIILVSFSRVYLGVHWTSDVVVGMLLGVLISYIFAIIFRDSKKRRHVSSR